MVTGYRIICEALASAGVDTIFGVMGEGNMPIIDCWVHDLGHRYVAARHEGGAVSMAEGHARAGSRVGVATVTQGPGVTNAMTALTSAGRQKSAVLLLAGALPTEGSPSAQRMDHRAVAAAAGAGYVELRSIHSARRALHDALHLVQSTRLPVVLDLPIDVQEMDWPHGEEGPRSVAAVAQRPQPSAEALDQALELLAVAERPTIVAGRGATRSGARSALQELASWLGAPLATSLQAKGLFGGHPLDLGIAGGFAHTHAQTILGDSDCVLAVGASLNTWTTQHGATFPAAAVIQVDSDATGIGTYTDVDVAIVADARAAADALVGAARDRLPEATQRRTVLEARIAEGRRDARALATTTGDLDAGAHVVGLLDEVLPTDRTVVLDAGHFMGWPILHLSVPEPDAFLWTCDFGSIGLGVATGIGAALARPDRLTVVVVGDGGLMMSLGELDTAARLRLPLVVVVLDDGAYGAEVQILRHQGRHADSAQFDNPSFTRLAEALGYESFALTTTADRPALEAAIANRSGPLLVACRIGGDIASWFRHMLP